MWFLKQKKKRKESSSNKKREEESTPELVTASFSSDEFGDSDRSSEKPFFVMDWNDSIQPDELKKVQDLLSSNKPKFPKPLVSMSRSSLRKDTFIRQISLRQSIEEINSPSNRHLLELSEEDAFEKIKSLNRLGLQSAQVGEFLKAIGYWTQSLQMLIHKKGEFDPEVALVMNNMGIAYGKINLYDESREMLEESLFIRKELFGEEHGEVAATLQNIGNLLLSYDQTEKALEAYLETRRIRTLIYGPHHEEVAFSYNGIGHAYYKMERYDDAYDEFSEAMRISTIAGLPMDHPVVEDSLSGINVLEEMLQ